VENINSFPWSSYALVIVCQIYFTSLHVLCSYCAHKELWSYERVNQLQKSAPPSLLYAATQSAAAAGISGLLPPPSLPVSDPSSSPHKLFIHPSRGSPRCPCREIRKHICRLHVRRGDLHGRARRGLRHHASSDHICLRRRSIALRHQRPQGAASDFVDSSTASAFFPCLSGLSSSWSGICRHRSSAAT